MRVCTSLSFVFLSGETHGENAVENAFRRSDGAVRGAGVRKLLQADARHAQQRLHARPLALRRHAARSSTARLGHGRQRERRLHGRGRRHVLGRLPVRPGADRAGAHRRVREAQAHRAVLRRPPARVPASPRLSPRRVLRFKPLLVRGFFSDMIVRWK